MATATFDTQIKEAQIEEANPDTNRGSLETATVSWNTTVVMRSVWWISAADVLAQIPFGSTINSASFDRHATNALNAEVTFQLNRLTQPAVVESEITYNNINVRDPWTSAGGDFDANVQVTYTGPAASGDKSVDIATLVQDALDNRSGFVGAVEKLAAESGATARLLAWATRENGTAANRPVIVVDYTAPAYRTKSMLLTGVG